MASAIHRSTLEVKSRGVPNDLVNPDWIINPDLSAVDGQPKKYWKIVGDSVQLMTQSERDSVDAAEDASRITAEKQAAIDLITGKGDPVLFRALTAIMAVNQREVRALKNAARGQGQPRPDSTLEELTIEAIGDINNG